MSSPFKSTPFKAPAIHATPAPKAVTLQAKASAAPPAIHYKSLVSEAHVPAPPKPMKEAFPQALKMAGVSGGQRPRQEKIQGLQKGQLG